MHNEGLSLEWGGQDCTCQKKEKVWEFFIEMKETVWNYHFDLISLPFFASKNSFLSLKAETKKKFLLGRRFFNVGRNLPKKGKREVMRQESRVFWIWYSNWRKFLEGGQRWRTKERRKDMGERKRKKANEERNVIVQWKEKRELLRLGVCVY